MFSFCLQLSFKSPSDDEYLTNDVLSDQKFHLAASTKNLEGPFKKDVYLEIPNMSITESDQARNKPQASQDLNKNTVDSTWEMLTSRLDHQIQVKTFTFYHKLIFSAIMSSSVGHLI